MSNRLVKITQLCHTQHSQAVAARYPLESASSGLCLRRTRHCTCVREVSLLSSSVCVKPLACEPDTSSGLGRSSTSSARSCPMCGPS
eukprot:1167005-Pleurochrysis_carterae.AAC.4